MSMTTAIDTVIARGGLMTRLAETAAAALAAGALHPIDTREQIIDDGGIPFAVRTAENLQRKEEQRARQEAAAPAFDPFLAPEPALTLGPIGNGHVAVLNKYNVVEHHLLIVTRRFEPQESLLTLEDLDALCWCLREIDGLGFYNGGAEAGASQQHKHLQFIPALNADKAAAFPIEAVLPQPLDTSSHHHAGLPFPHRIADLPPGLFASPRQAAAYCLRLYRLMLAELGQTPLEHEGRECQSAPYNLLLTRRWLMLVPRTREHFGGISINAMGFAGSLFVLDEKGLEEIRRAGPVAILRAVSS